MRSILQGMEIRMEDGQTLAEDGSDWDLLVSGLSVAV